MFSFLLSWWDVYVPLKRPFKWASCYHRQKREDVCYFPFKIFLVISINLKRSVTMGHMRIDSASIDAVMSSLQMPFAMSNPQKEIVWVRAAGLTSAGLNLWHILGEVGVLLRSLAATGVINKMHLNFMGTGPDPWFARINKWSKTKQKNKTKPNQTKPIQTKKSTAPRQKQFQNKLTVCNLRNNLFTEETSQWPQQSILRSLLGVNIKAGKRERQTCIS